MVQNYAGCLVKLKENFLGKSNNTTYVKKYESILKRQLAVTEKIYMTKQDLLLLQHWSWHFIINDRVFRTYILLFLSIRFFLYSYDSTLKDDHLIKSITL